MPATVERSLAVLNFLASDDAGSTVSEVAEQLNMSLASASRMMRTLRDSGAVCRDESNGRLFPAMGLWQLGSAALRRLDFRRIAVPAIAAVVPELGRPINLTVPDLNNAISVETFDVAGRFVISTPVGKPTPYHATTNGKAILAHLQPDALQRILSQPLARYTAETITDREQLEAELARIRERGVSLNRGEFRTGGVAVSVALLNEAGRPLAAFSTPASLEELDRQSRPARILINLVQSMSAQLGYAVGGHEDFA